MLWKFHVLPYCVVVRERERIIQKMSCHFFFFVVQGPVANCRTLGEEPGSSRVSTRCASMKRPSTSRANVWKAKENITSLKKSKFFFFQLTFKQIAVSSSFDGRKKRKQKFFFFCRARARVSLFFLNVGDGMRVIGSCVNVIQHHSLYYLCVLFGWLDTPPRSHIGKGGKKKKV